MNRPEYDAETMSAAVADVANTRALNLGFDPEVSEPRIRRDLLSYDHAFLDDVGIGDRESLWVANYPPPPVVSVGDWEEATAGETSRCTFVCRPWRSWQSGSGSDEPVSTPPPSIHQP